MVSGDNLFRYRLNPVYASALRLEIKDSSEFAFWNLVCLDLPDAGYFVIHGILVLILLDNPQVMAKSFRVTNVPGADDKYIRVYNYNTMAMGTVKVFKAHSDFIRCVAVHPTLPYVLSSSDDMLIKLWDWEKGWACTQIFKGHSHSVMQVTFNPKDTNTFASASLDRTIKIWNLGSPYPNFTLDAHQKGLNCVDYFTGGDKPYLITGSDDHTAKVCFLLTVLFPFSSCVRIITFTIFDDTVSIVVRGVVSIVVERFRSIDDEGLVSVGCAFALSDVER
ncbi:hypothetical protein F2Q69_00041584 [Brassica cretica]|uniref:Coatomer WD associated region domain-containing protein n=1 Tax=Brassica cretica TaxID=69181 RepID=A0A8S9NHX3_BRACR|nr:hypothetical protein F2Q69_00041584 [Brassica cretica]